MHLRARPLSTLSVALTAISFTVLGPAAASQGAAAPTQQAPAHSCATAKAGFAACKAIVRTDIVAGTSHAATAAPSGYGPSSLQSAYKLPSATAGSGRTVAIVDAYNDPTAEADLGVYRSHYGLRACTTANGCFKKIDQNGGTSYPATDGGWTQEISLDLDMVSAICPNCHILLVEAKSASFANLGAAVNRAAATKGVVAISNSYGGSDASDSTYGSYYNHPGIAVTASSGDNGYGASYPASSHYVTAVGGTTLSTASNSRGWTETAWSRAGSGCSAYNSALSGAAASGTGCTRRAEADVSAVADPSTGVAVYDSTTYQGLSGWLVFGGTSVSSPVIASVYALAGNSASIDNNYPYRHASSLNDVTSGSNGLCLLAPSQWCHARAGWDGPTGLGTPNGTGAF
ncbi:S53 family peptidase [Actinacidiphila acidipaludis]|uniref:S53 family peptidase n=1 Tax=Actinacidiphila acidipaludis TaxID=2873382 RepID=A0ABS7Q350_9ACTN|nr:S53 family peptidase [Streptomyces acidipaludis]MBY8877383.1 S53 family peptidase [Streptomyces acidipaludis]